MISIRFFVPQDHSIGVTLLVECREKRAVYRDHRGHVRA